MKTFINAIFTFIITFIIIFVGNIIAPQYIYCEDWKQAIFATLIIFVVNFVFSAIFISIISKINKQEKGENTVTSIIGLIIGGLCAIMGNIISIGISDKILDGFEVKTTGAYVIVLILMSLFSISTKPSKSA